MAGYRGLRILQANLNCCGAAQELWFHSLAQLGIGLSVVTEPYRVRQGDLSSTCGKVTVARREEPGSPPLSLLERGEGFVAGQWGEVVVVGCYSSPNDDLRTFEGLLERVGDFLSRTPSGSILVAGDLNSWSVEWGSRVTKVRGVKLGDWARGLGLRVMNRGSAPTCVRPQGESIVDVTFASPEVERRLSEWRVLEEETMSDHLYITMVLSPPPETIRRPPRREGGAPRWALRTLDPGSLLAALRVVAWAQGSDEPCEEVEAGAEWFRRALSDVSDFAMARAGPPLPRRSAYWWTEEVACARDECTRARRLLTDFRGGFRGMAVEDRPPEDRVRVELLCLGHREKKKALTKEIRGSKRSCWKTFLESLDRDPWGRPYIMARKKFRAWAPPLTETLDPQFLEEVVNTLFPACREEEDHPPPWRGQVEWSEELRIQEEELESAMRRLGAKNTAPGPDGLLGKVWTGARILLGARLRRLFDGCLRSGVFPRQWKIARLVLLRKEGRPEDRPSAYRPICLLDEAGKLFERVIAARVGAHLSGEGPNLAANQFGFRGGHSTIDAIDRVRTLTEQAVSRGKVAVAVSLDIANAFNSLPWDRIRGALEFHGVPAYIRRVLWDYLRDRWVEYVGRDGETRRRRVSAGVPQGSVLGPLLWNLGYNSVLRAAIPAGLSVTCYADDTLVMACGETWAMARELARVGTEHIVGRIAGLGLRVDLNKTEAMFLHAPRQRPPKTSFRVGGVRIRVGPTMKYLGLTLDGTWSFSTHLEKLGPRVAGAALALGRLLPNLGGPGFVARRLFYAVVRSMALYGAPVWARDLHRSSRNRRLLRRMGRTIAIRVARGYRTIREEVAFLLAGVPPMDILAEMFRDTYFVCRDIRRGPWDLARKERAIARVKRQARAAARERWQRQLAELGPGADRGGFIGAVQPCLDAWLDREHGAPTYRVTQVLSGHGCFGEYLRRIERENSPRCHQCGAAVDTARHTLEECPKWEAPRRVLMDKLGVADLSLSTIVPKMVDSDEVWDSVASFIEEVMESKEAEERRRELAGDAGHAPERPRGRRRRRQPAALPGPNDRGDFVAPAGPAPRARRVAVDAQPAS